MKKKGMVVALTVGLLGSSLAAPTLAEGNKEVAPNVLSTKKFNEAVKSPEFVSGALTSPSSKKANDIILDYIDSKKAEYKLGSKSAKESFVVKSTEKDKLGNTIVRLQQVFNGVEVWGSTQVAHVNDKGVLTVVSGTVLPDLDKVEVLKQKPKTTAKQAVETAKKDLGLTPEFTSEPTVKAIVYKNGDNVSFAYVVGLNFLSPEPGRYEYFIDANTGKVVDKYNIIHNHGSEDGEHKEGNVKEGETKNPVNVDVVGTTVNGTGTGVLGDTKSFKMVKSGAYYYLQDDTRGKGVHTFDAKNRTSLPGTLWRSTDTLLDAAYDRAAVDAHAYASQVYDYYKDVFGRNSFDNNGAILKSVVHYGRNYNNAFWDGTQMVYGDGDGTTFTSLSGGLDVIAHELTHAVTERTSNLIYRNESGALNESISDIFGTLLEFHTNNNPDYLIGEDIYTPNTPGDAFRSMSDPTAYGDPDHYSKRFTGTGDNGGVHINSGIINKAAYLLAVGGTHYNVSVTGIGNEKMGQIFYRANTTYFTASTTFSQARAGLVQAAADLFGANSQEVNSVKQAFNAVGVQ
ncbi:M4 family metallopeptidase [Priestia taiwanensis]|uniref:Neutral metalloproteinase n=1 Tax=Priestia taiwanensis TaxID=1347902 RepID=A0A917EP80_9BACI|nr:M4 family metallopeptidase [Priestia taiwanensis]MBM7363929.1 thermolysin [Priestia taiwanensis]GGE70220.1 bacillolysin [Priestia taiwanensis]